MTSGLEVSVVVPVFDEAATLVDLHARLSRTLAGTGRTWEVVFVDDGSRDGSAGILRDLHGRDPAVRVVRLDRNYGQHLAVLAGMERARGDVIVTLDADLQNPPEEIPRLLGVIAEGVEVVGGCRVTRHDPWPRRTASWAMNRLASAALGVRMRDYGCMLRAYRRPVVERIVRQGEITRFIPVLATTLATSVAEVPVEHAPRRAGRSKYGVLRLVRLGVELALQVMVRGRRAEPGRRRPPRYVVSEVLE
jgi:undecaprenyl-phosphate 4-deoxy-4-formamido-L-arabinose transferase